MGSQTPNSRIQIGNFSRQLGWYYRSVSTQIHMSPSQLAFQVPHGVQQAMSAESMPMLSSAIAIFEIFMSQWEDLSKEFPKLTPWINVSLNWAKKYYNLMDDTDAYIVTMGELFILSHHELTVDHHL
jgi:hypothetical protein